MKCPVVLKGELEEIISKLSSKHVTITEENLIPLAIKYGLISADKPVKKGIRTLKER